jgi:hypothetical protein
MNQGSSTTTGDEDANKKRLPNSFAVGPADVLKLFVQRDRIFVTHVSA